MRSSVGRSETAVNLFHLFEDFFEIAFCASDSEVKVVATPGYWMEFDIELKSYVRIKASGVD